MDAFPVKGAEMEVFETSAPPFLEMFLCIFQS